MHAVRCARTGKRLFVMIFLDLINLKKIRKAIIYLFCIVLTLWLQTMVFSRVAFLGAKPFFVPALVVAIGLFEGGVWGGALGLVAGFYCDMSLSGNSIQFMVFCTACGFLSGCLVDFVINRRFVSYMLLAALALLAAAFIQAAPLWLFHGTAPVPLFSVAGLQALWSLPFAVLFYYVTRAIAGMESAQS